MEAHIGQHHHVLEQGEEGVNCNEIIKIPFVRIGIKPPDLLTTCLAVRVVAHKEESRQCERYQVDEEQQSLELDCAQF